MPEAERAVAALGSAVIIFSVLLFSARLLLARAAPVRALWPAALLGAVAVFHGNLSKHFDIEVPYDKREFVHAEVQKMKTNCTRDTTEVFNEQDGPCAQCLTNAVMVAKGDAKYGGD